MKEIYFCGNCGSYWYYGVNGDNLHYCTANAIDSDSLSTTEYILMGDKTCDCNN